MLCGLIGLRIRPQSKCLHIIWYMASLAIFPLELEHKAQWAIKACNMKLDDTGVHRKLQLQELEEIQNDAYENAKLY